MPVILKQVNDMILPRIYFDGGYVDKVNINLGVRDNNSVSLAFNQKSNGAVLRAFNIEGEITGIIKYKVLFVSVDANFRVTFDYGAVSMQTTFPLGTQIVNGRQIPKVDMANFFMNIDASKIKISLSGSVIADILDKIVWTFKSVVITVIQQAINREIPPQVNAILNDLIVQSNGLTPIFDGVGLDFQMPKAPLVTDTSIFVYLNGTLFDMNKGYSVPDTAIAGLEANLTDRAQMVVQCSAYSADSFLSVFNGKRFFDFAIDKYSFNTLLQDYLTTTYLDGILPGLVAKYGEDKSMSLNFRSALAPRSFLNLG